MSSEPDADPGIYVSRPDTGHKDQLGLPGEASQAPPVPPAGAVREAVRGEVRVETVKPSGRDVGPVFVVDQKTEEDTVQLTASDRQVALAGEEPGPLGRRQVVRVVDVEHGEGPGAPGHPVVGRVGAVGRVHVVQVAPQALGGTALVRLHVETDLEAVFGGVLEQEGHDGVRGRAVLVSLARGVPGDGQHPGPGGRDLGEVRGDGGGGSRAVGTQGGVEVCPDVLGRGVGALGVGAVVRLVPGRDVRVVPVPPLACRGWGQGRVMLFLTSLWKITILVLSKSQTICDCIIGLEVLATLS